MKFFLKKIAFGIVAFAMLGFVAGVLLNARRVATVTVTLLRGHEEPWDLALPGQAEAAPDYRLHLRSTDGWVDCGTFQNTPIGAGLTWNVRPLVPERTLVEYQLVESDRGLDDLLDQVPATAASVEGNNFRFERTTEYALDAGFAWFVSHPIGQVIGLAFGVVIGAWFFTQFAL